MMIRVMASVLILLAAGVLPADAQGRTALKIGGGILGNEYEILAEDAHLMGSAAAFGPWNAIGVRGDVLVGTTPLAGASAAVVVRWPKGKVRPYLFTGYSYQITERSSGRPLSQDFGVVHGGGVVAAIGGREWFLEVSPRLYWNVFYTYAATRTVLPLTIGLSD